VLLHQDCLHLYLVRQQYICRYFRFIQTCNCRYTFAKFDLDQSLAMMKEWSDLGLGLKIFNLPLNSTKEVIDQTLAKMKSSGVQPYGVGPIYMKTEASVDQAFAYSKWQV